MFGRENLEDYEPFDGIYTYNKSDADKVMNAMESRIKDLEKANEILIRQSEGISRTIDDSEKRYYEKCNELIHERKYILEQESRIKELEASQPKWISVDERLPSQKDLDKDLQDAHGVYLWITDGQTTYYGSYTFENKSFYKNDDLKKPIKTTHWMYGNNWIPKPPTTDKSTSDIKENLITKQTNNSEG